MGLYTHINPLTSASKWERMRERKRRTVCMYWFGEGRARERKRENEIEFFVVCAKEKDWNGCLLDYLPHWFDFRSSQKTFRSDSHSSERLAKKSLKLISSDNRKNNSNNVLFNLAFWALSEIFNERLSVNFRYSPHRQKVFLSLLIKFEIEAKVFQYKISAAVD